ncbi:MAG: hypothetical protein J07HX64_02814 [halophilic archaeon J07HX64]|nr:MAG: hypothetical protein J07HX64_02814 [halophilic archaeon J07HX64]
MTGPDRIEDAHLAVETVGEETLTDRPRLLDNGTVRRQ